MDIQIDFKQETPHFAKTFCKSARNLRCKEPHNLLYIHNLID